jgi:hypothetical protein
MSLGKPLRKLGFPVIYHGWMTGKPHPEFFVNLIHRIAGQIARP